MGDDVLMTEGVSSPRALSSGQVGDRAREESVGEAVDGDHVAGAGLAGGGGAEAVVAFGGGSSDSFSEARSDAASGAGEARVFGGGSDDDFSEDRSSRADARAARVLGGGSSDDFSEGLEGERVVEGRARRRRKRRSAQFVCDPEAWRRFTPVDIDQGRCMARVFCGGRGGQCYGKCHGESKLCRQHERSTPHGLVTGEIPQERLQWFLNAERRRILRGDAGGPAGARRADEKPRPGRRCHWYARFYMWAAGKRARARGDRRASRGALRAVEELWADELAEALLEVNEYFRKNGQQSQGLEKDQGPGSAAEAQARPELLAYNGLGGGNFSNGMSQGTFWWSCESGARRCIRVRKTNACRRWLRRT